MRMQPANAGAENLHECAERRTAVAVIGGGMAGTWVAYQLAKAGVETILMTYTAADRGGFQGSSRRSAGAFSVVPLSEPDLGSYLDDLGRGQTHPSVASVLLTHFPRALDELRTLLRLKPVKVGFAIEYGGGETFVEAVQRRFVELGGCVVRGWVTRLMVSPRQCQGFQYECAEGIGKIRANAIVVATGGYSGLFKNAIQTNCYGGLLGACLERGGFATNLEFLFKHGYGNVDANVLTPTEELPGAEIYDRHHERVGWLEQMLFHRQGTQTHLQAAQHWLRDPENEYFVDLSYRPLYLKLRHLDALVEGDPAGGTSEALDRRLAETLELFPPATRASALDHLRDWVRGRQGLSYSTFERLKPLLGLQAFTKFRVRPLTYFSMGGIGHRDFATGLQQTYVTGEAMHDFGANRVGGLPWSLYLASGCAIAERLAREGRRSWEPGQDFELVRRPSRFDPALLHAIQQRLHEVQERELTAARARDCVDWLRATRRDLRRDESVLHDGIPWLIAAEAVMVASAARAESRGFFFRFDHPAEDPQFDKQHSCAWYDEASDTLSAQLLPVGQAAPHPRNGDEPVPPTHEAVYEHH